MAFRSLFVARPEAQSVPKPPFGSTTATAATVPGGADGGGGSPDKAVGIFLTPQSLASFPGASLAVTVLCTLAGKLAPSLTKGILCPVIASFFIGAIIFVATINDAGARPKSRSAWIVGAAVAFLNAAYLAAVAAKLFPF